MKWTLVAIITCWSYAPGAPQKCKRLMPQSEALPMGTLHFETERECMAAGTLQGRRILEWTRKTVSTAISGRSIPVCVKGGGQSL